MIVLPVYLSARVFFAFSPQCAPHTLLSAANVVVMVVVVIVSL